MRHRPALAVACCLAAMACERATDAPEPVAVEPADPPTPVAASIALPAIMAEIEAQAAALEAIEGEVAEADATIRYRAYADSAGQLLFVDEDLTAGDYGATRDRYYFVDGRLAYFYREGSQLVAMPPDPPGLGDVVMFLAFNDDGTAATLEKRLKGRVATPESFEVRAVARRAAELRKTVAYARAEPLGENEYAGYVVFNPVLSTFQPCGQTSVYWLGGEDAAVDALRDAYQTLLGDAAGQPAYARLIGQIGDPIREGQASNYPAVFLLERQTALERRAERDCP